jgi:hypothetical protein
MTIATVGSGTRNVGRDRQEVATQGSGSGGLCREAGYDSALVSKLIAEKFDGSKHRSYSGRPRISPEMEALIVRLARENGSWGYDRIAGALKSLDHEVSVISIDAAGYFDGLNPSTGRGAVKPISAASGTFGRF